MCDLLQILPGLDEIAQAVNRGSDVADHLPALTRLITQAEREHYPALDACATYCRAIGWLRSLQQPKQEAAR